MDMNYPKLYKKQNDSDQQLIREFVYNFVLTPSRRLHLIQIIVSFKLKYKNRFIDPNWLSDDFKLSIRELVELANYPNSIPSAVIDIVRDRNLLSKVISCNSGQQAKIARQLYWDIVFHVSVISRKVDQELNDHPLYYIPIIEL